MKNFVLISVMIWGGFALAENPHDKLPETSETRPTAESSELSPFVPVSEESVGVIQEGVDHLENYYIESSGTQLDIATFESSQTTERL